MSTRPRPLERDRTPHRGAPVSAPTSPADLVILGGGSGGYAAAFRAVRARPERRPHREGQGRRHLPAPRLHPDQGAAARRRGRRPGPRGRAVRRQDVAGRHRHGRRQRLQGRRRRQALQGPAGPGEGPQDHLRRGRGPAHLPDHGRGERPELRGQAHPAGHRLLRPQRCPASRSTAPRSSPATTRSNLDRVPASAIILGGGVIGCEFASAWKSFGVDVTIVEALPHLVPLEDEASSKLLERAFRRRKIGFELGSRFSGVQNTENGVKVSLENGKEIEAELLLVAVGRGPVSQGLGYEEAGVADGPRLRPRRRVLPHQRPDRLRRRRPHPDPAAGPRRLRRGHPRRRAGRRPRARARSTTPASRGSPTPTPRSPRSASPRRRPRRSTARSRPSPTTSPATARARSSRRPARSS